MKRSLLIQKNIVGFTLAEVLITLTIIGVIAALTIPSLITSIQDQQYRTAYKRIYSDLNQATNRLLMENSGDFTNIFTSTDVLRDDYAQYLSYTKKCNYGVNTPGNCWADDGVTKLMNGNAFAVSSTWTSSLVLNNEAFLKFEMNGASSTNCTLVGFYSLNMPVCAAIHIDVNGFKGPNIIGKDVYIIQVVKNGLKPVGVNGDGMAGTCNSTSGNWSGWGCAAEYLKQ